MLSKDVIAQDRVILLRFQLFLCLAQSKIIMLILVINDGFDPTISLQSKKTFGCTPNEPGKMYINFVLYDAMQVKGVYRKKNSHYKSRTEKFSWNIVSNHQNNKNNN